MMTRDSFVASHFACVSPLVIDISAIQNRWSLVLQSRFGLQVHSFNSRTSSMGKDSIPGHKKGVEVHVLKKTMIRDIIFLFLVYVGFQDRFDCNLLIPSQHLTVCANTESSL